jgi:hypothetical protein
LTATPSTDLEALFLNIWSA